MCIANQWTGFYMITATVMKELNVQNRFLLKDYFRTHSVNLFHTTGLFIYPLKTPGFLITTSIFLMFSGGIERDQ